MSNTGKINALANKTSIFIKYASKKAKSVYSHLWNLAMGRRTVRFDAPGVLVFHKTNLRTLCIMEPVPCEQLWIPWK